MVFVNVLLNVLEILYLGMAGPVDSNNYYIFLKKVTTQVSGLVGLLHSYSFDAFGRVFAIYSHYRRKKL